MIVGTGVSVLDGGVKGTLDGGSSTAVFNPPMGIAVDCAGKVYVADACYNRARVITH